MILSLSESDMLHDSYYKLIELGSYQKIAIEVPFLSRCIDMVLQSFEGDIISIEFKMRDWKKAVVQARDHSLGADLSYICLPQKDVFSNKMIFELEKFGLGLMSYNRNSNDPLKIIIPAKRNIRQWSMWTNSLINKLTLISN